MDKKKLWVGTLVVIVVLIIVAFFLGFTLKTEKKEPHSGTSTVELVSYFSERITTLGIEDVGQPIEGFDAQLLMVAFPGFHNSDFDGVDAYMGHYEMKESELEFILDSKHRRSSAEKAVSDEGLGKLLENTATRLGISVKNKDDIDELIARINTAEHLRTKIDGGASAFGIKIIPQKILEDSRCPVDVQCIQAGTVNVSATVKTYSDVETIVFGLNQIKIIDNKAVTLLYVSPERQSGLNIGNDDYRFTFLVQETVGEK